MTSAPRIAVLLAVWFVLEPSAAPADVAIGACAVLLASWVSVRISPPGTPGISVPAILAYVPRFLVQSFRGGLDVARRAFSPDMRLHTDYVEYETRIPRGIARNTFATITSLMPGTVPCAERASTIVYHCLDASQPVARQLRDEEDALQAALPVKSDG